MMGDTPLLLSGMLGWRHAFGDRTAESIHAFDTDNAVKTQLKVKF